MYTALVKNYNSPFLLYNGQTELTMGNMRLISNWHKQTGSSTPYIYNRLKIIIVEMLAKLHSENKTQRRKVIVNIAFK